MEYKVTWEATPNPQSLKFIVNQQASSLGAAGRDRRDPAGRMGQGDPPQQAGAAANSETAGAAEAEGKSVMEPEKTAASRPDPAETPDAGQTTGAESRLPPSNPPPSAFKPFFFCDEIFEADSPQKAARSPLASKILGFPWAKSVFMAENFVTVTKEDWVEWELAAEPLADLIKEHFSHGGKALLPQTSSSLEASEQAAGGGGSQEERIIREIIEKEVQPAVAMDGGYIDFVSYEDKKVYLNLQGACSGCPSSSYTLKEGIETRLKQSLPEIEEVIAV